MRKTINLQVGKFALALVAGAGLFTYTGATAAESSVLMQQQTIKVEGRVEDTHTGAPVIGANVILKGSTVGAGTNVEGKFTLLNVPVGSILQISCVGYADIEMPATAQMTIKLTENTHQLTELVVVGYSSMKKESLTGSLQTLKSDKITNVTTPNVENMLTGKAPGVYVATGGSQPGAEGKIIIRGKSTINGSTDPLWVIDGVIVGSSAGALNPADIESMTILKDAASTAIYGSQGANGVIVVTTKKSKKDGGMSVNVSAKVGVTKLNNGNLEVMNGAELYDYYKSFPNQSAIKFSRWSKELRDSNHSWWDLATQIGLAQDYNVSLSGGNQKLNSFFSAGLYDESGAVKGYDYTRYTTRLKVDYKPFKWLTIKPNLSGSIKDVYDAQYSVNAMYTMFPWDNPYAADGSPMPHKSKDWVNSNKTNYLYDLQWDYAKHKTYEFMGNMDFDVKLTEWLTFSSVNNYKWQYKKYQSYEDPRSNSGAGVNGRITDRNDNMSRRYTNQLLRFDKSFGDHNINALLGYEFNDYSYDWIESKKVSIVPGYDAPNTAVKPESIAGSGSSWAVQSYIFNANYSYNNRYMAQVSLRRDGASNFGTNKKYGNFFSLSAGWNMTNEEFMKDIKWIDGLKLRASYGSVGNRPNSLYPQYDLYSITAKYNEKSGALISQRGNPNLTWEKTYAAGVGIDATLFDRLRITFDYYNKQTRDLLYAIPISGVTGITAYWDNVGNVINNGFEVNVGVDIVKTNDWHWAVDANLGMNRNKVDKLYSGKDEVIIGGGSNIAGGAQRILKLGLDADTWYLREWAGVNPENGKPTWYKTDANNNRVITETYAEADEVSTLGAYTPSFFGGFSSDLSWKNLDFNAVFGYSVGGKIYNYFRSEIDADGAYTDKNQMKLRKGWSRWEKPGDIATHPQATYGNRTLSNKVSSRYLEDGSYLKLRSVTLGYNLKFPKAHITNLRIFFTGENLFTITNYSGVDPEVTPSGDYGVVGFVNPDPYPQVRKFMFGANITF